MSEPAARAGRSPFRLLGLDPSARTAFTWVAVITVVESALLLTRLVLIAALVRALLVSLSDGVPVPTGALWAFGGSVLAGVALNAAGKLVATAGSTASRSRLAGRLLRGRLGSAPDADATALLATSGLDRLDGVLGEQWPALICAVVLPLGAALTLLVLDPPAALTGIGMLPLIGLLGAVAGIGTSERTRSSWRQTAALGAVFLDSVRGVLALRLHGRAEARGVQIAAASDRHRRLTLSILRTAFLNTTVTSLGASMGVAVVAVVEGTRLAGGGVGLGVALTAILVAPTLYRPVVDLGARFHLDSEVTAVLTDLETVLAEPAFPRPTAGARTAVAHLRAGYPTRDVSALDRCQASFPPGMVSAIVGPSGAGKSTLLGVLAGLPIRWSGQATISGPVGYLPQDPHFPVTVTIAEAIGFSGTAPRANAPEWALDLAGLGEFELAATDQTAPVAALSAGQRHRVGLARAYSGPAVLAVCCYWTNRPPISPPPPRPSS